MKRYLKWLLPVIYLVYYGSITGFMHVHIEDGTSFIHTHPFKNTPEGTCHEHASEDELQIINDLITFCTDNLLFQPDVSTCFFSPLLSFTSTYITGKYHTVLHGCISLRAPPFFNK